MKKGSPEALEWGRRMRNKRKSVDKKEYKPESHGISKVRSMSKRNKGVRRHKSHTVYHAVPDLFYACAGVELLGPAAQTIWANKGDLASINPTDLIQYQIMPQVLPAAELAAIGVVIQKAAKWLGISRIGTKDVKVF